MNRVAPGDNPFRYRPGLALVLTAALWGFTGCEPMLRPGDLVGTAQGLMDAATDVPADTGTLPGTDAVTDAPRTDATLDAATGVTDLGPMDAGGIDTGPSDTGTVPVDSGVMDSGVMDSGVMDSGPVTCRGATPVRCGTVCVATDSDPNNCGTCGHVCSGLNATAVCTMGQCTPRCLTGFANCNTLTPDIGCEGALNRNPNCGACGVGCASSTSQVCAGGRCVDSAVFAQASCPSNTAPGCGMVDIPTSTGDLGDDSSAGAQPVQHGVLVHHFAIDVDEVTVARFRMFWNAGHPFPTADVVYPNLVHQPLTNDTLPPATTAGCIWSSLVGLRDNSPVNCVSWVQAQAFCVWDGGRLPTEAEWERAARGLDGRVYPWGSTFVDSHLCWHGDAPCTAGIFLVGASPWGVLDMAGNLSEWVADNYLGYSDTGCWGNGAYAHNNPLCNFGDPVDFVRTVRDSPWTGTVPSAFASATRAGQAPSTRDPGLGFRCARSLP